MKLRFLGGTVAGSRYLLSDEKHRLLVDCGMYQGVKTLRRRNWAEFPVEPATINAVVLTHAHIDHPGYLPALVKNGFKGKIYCTKATHDLCKVLLPDAGFLQEKDAWEALKHFESLHCHETFEPVKGMEVTFTPAGHILGSSCVHVRHTERDRTVVSSGDVGRQNDVIMRAPEPLKEADVLICESTYGDRRHAETDPEKELADIITRTAGRVLHHLKTLLPNERNSIVFAGFQASGRRVGKDSWGVLAG